jgi:uncharacterized LabA/DUF88 family protein
LFTLSIPGKIVFIHPVGFVPAVPVDHGPRAFPAPVPAPARNPLDAIRVAAFVDGFNLYHALRDLGSEHLKWLDIRALCEHFARLPDLCLIDVFYFSAYATWRPSSYRRHREYVRALQANDVKVVMGRFKEKDRRCWRCQADWKDHEEKETDVNIALQLLLGGLRGRFDRALLVSGDSDLAPAVRLLRAEAPGVDVRILTPPGRLHSMELVHAAGGLKCVRRIDPIHVARSLLPREIRDRTGRLVASRPAEYEPPAR